MEKRILIKIGGRAFADRSCFEELAAAMHSVDAEFVIVHGGGAEISQALQEANRHTVFIDGVRVTQKEDVDIVERVLSETVNARIADYLSQCGVPCRRMSGRTQDLLVAQRTLRNGVDIGFVGEIVEVNPQAVYEALEQRLTPVVSPISAAKDGAVYNVNADAAAAALAVGVQCTDLVYFSDVPGVKDENSELVPRLSVHRGTSFIQAGVISGGMVAKMESIFAAIEKGVERVHITRWQGRQTLENILTEKHIEKTTIYREGT